MKEFFIIEIKRLCLREVDFEDVKDMLIYFLD